MPDRDRPHPLGPRDRPHAHLHGGAVPPSQYAFDTLGYRRFEWKCNSLNVPSRRAALRFGFQFESIFRQHMIQKGRNRDTAWFAMIDADRPRLRAGYQAWLRPENFDAAGQQVVKLSF